MAWFPIAKPKAHSLTGRITLPLLMAAFKAVKGNRGKAGIDKVSLKMFEANLAENLQALLRQLKDGSFDPLPLLRRYLCAERRSVRDFVDVAALAKHLGELPSINSLKYLKLTYDPVGVQSRVTRFAEV